MKRGTAAVNEARRRVQQDTLGHRGSKGDPLCGIQIILRDGAENLTDKQWARLTAAIEANPAHDEAFATIPLHPPPDLDRVTLLTNAHG